MSEQKKINIRSDFPISDNQLKTILKQVVWDYKLSPDELLEIFKGKKEDDRIDIIQLKAKILNGYYWHDLIKWFGNENAKLFLKDEVIKKIFPPSYKQTLYRAKEILRR